MRFEVILGDRTFRVELNESLDRAVVDGEELSITWTVQKNGRRLLRIGDRLLVLSDPELKGRTVTFMMNGIRHRVEVKDERDLLLEKLGIRAGEDAADNTLLAPMPGKVLQVLVAADEDVEPGNPVVILEAMKMENELKAAASGKVAAIHVQPGDSVEKNQPLLEIKPRG